ncbi:helix-turn-helix transcriptional regulator [Nocardia callitridis]|uniref:HTH cro/C1-type domain-containing protein n=1 Tax=Nocardia callitridis TaxID=648753 RepID=A0ABP9KGF1_9NOCA
MTATRPPELLVPTLADFVRARRSRLGLNRQTLAAAADLSMGYVTKIEQGAGVSPTPSVLNSLTGLFALTADERTHLYRLAGRESELDDPTGADAGLDAASARRTVEALSPNPAALFGSGWDFVEGNQAFDDTFPGLRGAGNVLVWMFTNPRARLVHEEWEREAALAVGRYRHYAAADVDPEAVGALLEELGAHPDFRRLWTSGVVSTARPDPLMRLREPGTGTVFTVRVVALRTADTAVPQRLFLGLRR